MATADTLKPRRPGRPANKRELIVSQLRNRIVRGELGPGSRLPTQLALERDFSASNITIQQAMNELVRDGFIETMGPRGSFVRQSLPHLNHYALAVEFPEDQYLSQFYVALRNEAARFRSEGRRISIFYGISQRFRSDDYDRLLELVRTRRLAGLIFAQSPHCVRGSALLEEPNIPRVTIASHASDPGVPVVYPDLDSFIPKALDYLASRGRKRIAAIMTGERPQRADELRRAAAERGMDCSEHRIQGVHVNGPRWAHGIAQLLMHDASPPDGLVLLDDNVVEHATAGIAASGVRVPHDIEIVAHTNYPWPTPSSVPVRRLGYHVASLLDLCIQRLGEQRSGMRPKAVTLLPAMFEEELATRGADVESVAGV